MVAFYVPAKFTDSRLIAKAGIFFGAPCEMACGSSKTMKLIFFLFLASIRSEPKSFSERFKAFESSIYLVANRSGSHLGMFSSCNSCKHPAVEMLYRYAERYEEWASKPLESQENLNFVIVDMTGGGFGNQLLQAMQGLIIAVETQRALVIHRINTPEQALRAGIRWHPALAQRFDFDAVLPLMSSERLTSLGWPHAHTSFEIDLHTAKGLEFVTCRNWTADLAKYRFAKIWSVTDMHLPLLNPHAAATVAPLGHAAAFLLSRLLWPAAAELAHPVRLISRPHRSWDGPAPSLATALAAIRRITDATPSSDGGGGRLAVVGVHVRASANTPWLHFDHRPSLLGPPGLQPHPHPTAAPVGGGGDVGGGVGDGHLGDGVRGSGKERGKGDGQERWDPEEEEGWDGVGAYCGGDGRGVRWALGPCVARMLDDLGAQRGVVLWAADSDGLTASAAAELGRHPRVDAVVMLQHSMRERHDLADTWPTRLDAAFLSEADAFLGTALSTFTFIVHARSLLTPYLMGHVPGPCVRAAGSEAGLVSVSTGLLLRQNQGPRWLAEEDEELQQSTCVAAFEAIRHGCVGEFATCASESTLAAWAAPLLAEVDMASYYQLKWAREGWRDHVLVPHNGIDCTEQPALRPAWEGKERYEIEGLLENGQELPLGFRDYIRTVCAICRRRGRNCGCEGEDEEPDLVDKDKIGDWMEHGPVADLRVWETLRDYAVRYRRWALAAATQAEELQHIKWLILDVNGGIGNHIVMAVRGLMMAIRTNRPLVLHNTDFEAGPYNFSEVLPLINVDVPARLGWPGESTRVVAIDHRDGRDGVQFLGCGDFNDLESFRFVQMQGLGDVHLPLLNPHESGWFRQHLGPMPIFMLSHLLWTGRRERTEGVHISTLPATRDWDGNQTLGHFLARMRQRADSMHLLVVGVHLRTQDYGPSSRSAYNLFNHVQLLEEPWDGMGRSPVERYCLGDPSAMRVATPCIRHMIDNLRNETGRYETIVFWAADSEFAAKPCFDDIVQTPGVSVVRIQHSEIYHLEPEVQDLRKASALVKSSLMDLVLLAEVDVLMATGHSTYSYIAHARALVVPYYTGFTPGGCARASGSQGGFVSSRISHPSQMDAESNDDECIAVYCLIIHGCLEQILSCVDRGRIADWARPLNLQFDFVRFYEQMWAREGWRSHDLIPQTGIICSDILAQSKLELNSAIESIENANEKGVSSISTGEVAISKTSKNLMQSAECPRRPSTLILYSYFDSPRSRENLNFFLTYVSNDFIYSDEHCDSRLMFVFIINGYQCSVELPTARNVQIFKIKNTGSDFGGYSIILRSLGIFLGSESWKSGFEFFCFINSSCRGPFMPSYASNLKIHWTQPFLSKITDRIKLVGPSVHFIPASSSEAAFCDRKLSIWSNISATGAGPRVDGYMFVTDPVGMDVWLRKGDIFQEFSDKRDTVNIGEYGLSRAILEAGYGLDCLVQQFQGINFMDPLQWPGPNGFEFAASVNQVRAQAQTPAKFVYWLQPFEVVFTKSVWGEASGDDSDEESLGQLDQEVARSMSLLVENLYSQFPVKQSNLVK